MRRARVLLHPLAGTRRHVAGPAAAAPRARRLCIAPAAECAARGRGNERGLAGNSCDRVDLSGIWVAACRAYNRGGSVKCRDRGGGRAEAPAGGAARPTADALRCAFTVLCGVALQRKSKQAAQQRSLPRSSIRLAVRRGREPLGRGGDEARRRPRQHAQHGVLHSTAHIIERVERPAQARKHKAWGRYVVARSACISIVKKVPLAAGEPRSCKFKTAACRRAPVSGRHSASLTTVKGQPSSHSATSSE